LILLMDIGNTRTKWALADDMGNLSPMQSCLNTEIASFRLPTDKLSKVMVSNVAGVQMAQQLSQLLAPLVPAFVQVCESAAGVTNGYAPTLGTDRWAAVVAAWQRAHQACVVVNAGTAITIDSVDHTGRFLGGTISPGLYLMQNALNRHALQVNIHAGSGDAYLDDFATNTQDAVTMGGLHAAAGAILVALLQLQSHTGTTPKLILSGGDADIIAQALKPRLKQVMMLKMLPSDMAIVDDLVLQGLHVLHQH
jgi:type III pantothenate kinase